MTNNFIYIPIIFILFFSCSRKQNETAHGYKLYTPAKSYPINLEEGYTINPVSGDSIEPIINYLGDTIKSGVSIVAIGKLIHPDSIRKPQVEQVGKPKIFPTHANVHILPEKLTIIHVDENKLRKVKLGEGTSSHVLVNSIGDTIPTGVPLPAKGKKVQCLQPPAVPALPPQLKDDAIYNIQSLDIDQGMNSSRVLSLLEDKRGNLWFGTYLGGVSRYDGTHFIHFTKKEGLSDNFIGTILEDKNENLWFGTYGGGVTCYDGINFTHFTENEGLSNNDVLSMLEDKNGILWFGTEGALSRFDGTSFTHFTVKEGLSNNKVVSMLEDKNGILWFATEAGVSKFDGTSFTHFTEKEGLSNNLVNSMLEDKNGILWFATYGGGVSRFDGKNFSHFTEKEGLTNNVVSSILEDKNGILWFGTDRGVSKFDGTSFTHFTGTEGLNNNEILGLLEDKSGILWFATYGGGVSRFDGTSFTHFTEKEGLSNNKIFSSHEDKNGNLWFGTWGGEVLRYDGTRFIHCIRDEELSNFAISSILEDKNGKFWIGTFGAGVVCFDGTSLTYFGEKEGLTNNQVFSILEDKNGILWFGTAGGLSSYDGKRFTQFTEKEGLSNNTVLSMLEDKNGILWLGTKGGLTRYDGKSFIHFTEKEGLSNNKVWSILEDKNGILWFGTEGGGVSRYDGKNFMHYTVKEGLSDNNVWSILEDKNGILWFGTEKGLTHFKQNKDDPEHPEAIVLANQDGLRALDFNIGSLLDGHNHAWWGTGKSMVMLDLNRFTISSELPEIYLRQLDINEQILDYRQLQFNSTTNLTYGSVSRFENYPINLEVPYNKNHLTFHYSAIDWAAPHKIKYSYKLEGLSDDWSIATEETKVDYRNLPFGTYTFKVKAIGIAQEWSKPIDYSLTILPPWWFTWWAYVIYTFSFLAFMWKVHQLQRTRTIRIEREKTQERELKQAKEIEKAYLQLGAAHENLKATQKQLIQSEKMASLGELTAGIAHEIQNPLNFVNNFSDLNQELLSEMKAEIDKGNIEDVAAIANDVIANEEKINLHGKRADAIVKGMLQHSRSSSGVKEPTDINALADEYLRLAYHGLRAKDKSFNATLKTDYDESIGKIDIIPQDIGRALLNVITNAFYAVSSMPPRPPKGGETFVPTVTIKTRKYLPPLGGKGGQRVEVSVSDNGPGIPKSVVDKIFQPFFTTKPTGQGTGLGLSLSYDIIKAHGGELTVETEEGVGSTFIIKLPII